MPGSVGPGSVGSALRPAVIAAGAAAWCAFVLQPAARFAAKPGPHDVAEPVTDPGQHEAGVMGLVLVGRA